MELAPDLAPFADAIAFVDAIPDRHARAWSPAGHPLGLRAPFEPTHVHPVVRQTLHGSMHWDGIVPRYACVRLELAHPSVAPLAPRLRALARAHLGSDDALYVYAFAHRSERQRRLDALDQLAMLVRSARDGS